MTLMATMTAWWLLRFFCFMIRKAKPDALSSARLFLITNILPSLQSSHEFREAYYLN